MLESRAETPLSVGLETKALRHPDFEDLGLGERRTASMVAIFLDLTDFTGRTFWDEQNEVVDLAHAVLSGFVEVISKFGGHPIGLRGDGLFAGFTPGDESFSAAMALSACAFALDGIENEVNSWLEGDGKEPVQARAGLDFGPITFVRTGSRESSEVNPLGFAANFAAKCEKMAKSWEILAGEGLANLIPDRSSNFAEHDKSPKRYTRHHDTKPYKFYEYRWRKTVKHLPGVIEALNGTDTSQITGR